MRLPSRRQGYFLVAAACACAMGAALYLQHVVGLEPCPLCIFQRVGVIAVGVLALLAGLANPSRGGVRIANGLIVLAAVAGGAVSTRQLWLQSLPADQVPSCGPGLDYMLSAFPLHDVVVNVFKGSGECAVVDWTFLGMALPFWVLTFFAAVIVYTLWPKRSRR